MKFGKSGALFLGLFLFISCWETEGKEYVVVIDPGHGGAPRRERDDKWDALSGLYLQRFAVGTQTRVRGRVYREHELVLLLGKRVQRYLALTRTRRGWKRFQKLLRRFSDEKKFRRLRFRVKMTRENGWTGRIADPNVNDPYRLYDFPGGPGRMSIINAARPHLTVSLHMNPAGRGHKGGMAAVLAPGYETFNLIRKISLGKKKRRLFRRNPWRRGWLVTDRGWNKYHAARSDSWVYFHGYRTKKNGSVWKKKYRGYRYNMVRWRYADAPGWERKARRHLPGPYSLSHAKFQARGKFWDRERGRPEYWRREGGPLGYGGDNHYASDELLRFVQYGVRRLVPARRRPGAVGKILTPFVSTYSLPTFINSICAYLEIGHINRTRDLTLVTRDLDATARSLAAGIYSLFAGLRLKRRAAGPYLPRGKALNFKKYESAPGGNYFKIVSD